MHEPTTALTDFLLAGLAWWWAWRLRQPGPRRELSRRLWMWGIVAQGAGAFLGGVYHGFLPSLSSVAIALLWPATLVFLGGASTLLVAGLARAVLTEKVAHIWHLLLAAKFLVYAVIVSTRKDFLPALCDQGVALLLLVTLLILGRRLLGRITLLVGVGLVALVLGGVIQHLQIGLGEHFNHNDIYHVLGGLTLWCFYRAGCRFRDAKLETREG